MKAQELRIGNTIQRLDGSVFNVTADDLSIIESWGVNKYLLPKPIPLTEEWLLRFGFENWGNGTIYNNEFEKYDRFVLFNVIDGSSNFEVHYIKSTYGNRIDFEYVISCDEDDRINWGKELKYVHQLQNLYFALTGQELELK